MEVEEDENGEDEDEEDDEPEDNKAGQKRKKTNHKEEPSKKKTKTDEKSGIELFVKDLPEGCDEKGITKFFKKNNITLTRVKLVGKFGLVFVFLDYLWFLLVVLKYNCYSKQV